jgi:hypothetical protein
MTAESPLVIIGRHALDTTLQGGGSAAVRPPHSVSIADGLREALGVARLRVFDGVAVRRNPPAAAPELIIDRKQASRVSGWSASMTPVLSGPPQAVRLPNCGSACRTVRTRERA